MTDRERLERLLRPAGAGIYTVSSGGAEQEALQRRIYFPGGGPEATAADATKIAARWRQALDRLPAARLVILGVPSDVGAGYVRGANLGPRELRATLVAQGSRLYADDPRVVDAGDVLVVPQLLHDDMISPGQLEATRRALHPDLPAGAAADLPVSPLSAAEEALRILRRLAPGAAPLVLGGDHSVAWPAFAAVAAERERRVGVLHFDAHTDLLAQRLGVRYCFATWAYHANERMGRGGRLVQVGLRTSRRTREEWERDLEVRQYWMEEVRRRPIDEIAAEIVTGLRAGGVEGLYISNDIDATDPAYGACTGTPEPGGLTPDEVIALVSEVGRAFPVWGSDLVEVAPPVAQAGGRTPEEPGRTLATAARYLEAQARVTLAAPGRAA